MKIFKYILWYIGFVVGMITVGYISNFYFTMDMLGINEKFPHLVRLFVHGMLISCLVSLPVLITGLINILYKSNKSY